MNRYSIEYYLYGSLQSDPFTAANDDEARVKAREFSRLYAGKRIFLRRHPGPGECGNGWYINPPGHEYDRDGWAYTSPVLQSEVTQ